MFAYTDIEDKALFYQVQNFDAANKLLPAILLMVSIVFFRCKFNNNQSKKVFAREKIIAVHLAVFLSFVTSYVAYLVCTSFWQSSPEMSIQNCQFFVLSWYFLLFA